MSSVQQAAPFRDALPARPSPLLRGAFVVDRRSHPGRSATRTTGASAYRCAALTTGSFQNLSAVGAVTPSRNRLRAWPQQQIAMDGKRNVGGAFALRTDSVRAGCRRHGSPAGFLGIQLDAQNFGHFLDRRTRQGFRPTRFQHADGRLLAADPACQLALRHALRPAGIAQPAVQGNMGWVLVAHHMRGSILFSAHRGKNETMARWFLALYPALVPQYSPVIVCCVIPTGIDSKSVGSRGAHDSYRVDARFDRPSEENEK